MGLTHIPSFDEVHREALKANRFLRRPKPYEEAELTPLAPASGRERGRRPGANGVDFPMDSGPHKRQTRHELAELQRRAFAAIRRPLAGTVPGCACSHAGQTAGQLPVSCWRIDQTQRSPHQFRSA